MTAQDVVRVVWLVCAAGGVMMTAVTLRLAVGDYRVASRLEHPNGRKLIARILVRDEMLTIGVQLLLTVIAVHAWIDPEQTAVRGVAYTLVVLALGWNSTCRWRDRVNFERSVKLPDEEGPA